MTEILTDQQLNRELAEKMGYTVQRGTHNVWTEWYELKRNSVVQSGALNEDMVWDKAPDYCTDPASSLEVQAAAIAKDPEEYIRNLSIVQNGPDPKIKDFMGLELKGVAKACDATPRERAMAAWVTLSNIE
ncbi:hypothetical protein KIH86_24040 [Paenibacillus sp. HN-1]|uniref:hypothetical protein n=1 Tax=Paenibacillus TaxID=44249 RepID=UPI001CA9D7E1|nr:MULTISPECIES: hypothetical protein [Paenibacillus]MBY9081222.1 hypothetical protein [Paenibacillus sp. CGMCC 1.18879]MBY9087259.1 hypothetical protein [Paenibacillus sinensis]